MSTATVMECSEYYVRPVEPTILDAQVHYKLSPMDLIISLSVRHWDNNNRSLRY